METIDNKDPGTDYVAHAVLTDEMAVDLCRKYVKLDDALSARLAPASHKKHYTENLAEVLVQMGWPKMPPPAEAALAALYLADDYINDLADEDTVKQVKTDIREATLLAGKELSSSPGENASDDRLLFDRARDLANLIGEYIARELAASPEVADAIRAIQNNVSQDARQPPPPSGPRALPAQPGGQGHFHFSQNNPR